MRNPASQVKRAFAAMAIGSVLLTCIATYAVIGWQSGRARMEEEIRFLKASQEAGTRPVLNVEAEVPHQNGSLNPAAGGLLEKALLFGTLAIFTGTLVGLYRTYRVVARRRPVQSRPRTREGVLEQSRQTSEKEHRDVQQILALLGRSTREVQRFAYIASHDLQEPVRQIANHVSLIERRYGSRLDPDGIHYLQFAVSGAKRLQAQINDLLEYSTLGSEPMKHTQFPLERALQYAISRTPGLAPGAVRLRPLPEILGDERRIRRVFEALLSNCVKFRQPDTPLSVLIEAHKVDPFWEIRITDNGIGFDQRYEAKIFEVFGRLNGPAQFSGTGMGLALVRRIIEDHGGSTRANSSPGMGATFVFTLPVMEHSVETVYEYPVLENSARR